MQTRRWMARARAAFLALALTGCGGGSDGGGNVVVNPPPVSSGSGFRLVETRALPVPTIGDLGRARTAAGALIVSAPSVRDVFRIPDGGSGAPVSLAAVSGQSFGIPSGIAVSPVSGTVYVTDRVDNLVRVFGPNDDAFLFAFGGTGNGAGRFRSPVDVAVDGSGFVYVADYANQRVQKFSADGVFVAAITTGGGVSGGPGTALLADVASVAADAAGNVYVGSNGVIQMFDASGAFSRTIGAGIVSRAGSMAVGPNGDLFVANENVNRLERFDRSSGERTASVDLTFAPGAIAVGTDGSVIVADRTSGNRIAVFTPSP